ncbi:unnamed protein product [Nyctereutes procyonoides]|uniref:40S ribosomal protein S25 n=1 Tax=Nyctereutes procyonoides TaxID=34880 RepID=A0A811YRM0_NYCPR|nr:unnamed protein product [Nyctereutes procyonoides]
MSFVMPLKDDKKKKDAGKTAKKKKDRDPKKWSKGKVRHKLHNLVFFDKATCDKLGEEVPNYKLITPAIVSETEDLSKGIIILVSEHRAQVIYTRKMKGGDLPADSEDA